MYRVHVRGLCSCANSYKAGVVFFNIYNHLLLGVYIPAFLVMHMVYDILVVYMIVYDMQV